MKTLTAGLITFSLLIGVGAAYVTGGPKLSDAEMAMLQSMALDALEPLPADPSNKYADDARAAELGRDFFFDTRFSSNGKVSCATCHMQDRQFQDDVDLAKGVGTTNRRTMPIAGTAYSPWMFWDGRKDSQWSQALGPLESPVEHGGTRGQYVRLVAREYAEEYRNVFGDVDFADTTRVFVNIGKAIAAYERTLQFNDSRFDVFARTGEGFNAEEVAGAKLFVGKANCAQCHNGPMLTDNVFHNTGVSARADLPRDLGRAAGAKQVLNDEFNCRSKWSDAKAEDCAELNYMVAEGHDLERAFKTPSLRSVASRSPYMHAGQIKTLAEVLDHYNRAPAAPAGHSEIVPLKLSQKELQQLEAFLKTLESPVKDGK
jgi:cytochrome c peroxidase